MRYTPSLGDIAVARKHKLKRRGFKYPVRTVWAARLTKTPLSYAAACLEKESALGQNVFGHDPVRNPIKGGKVTKKRYLQYKAYRKQGLGMQGVGPTQLTYYTLQDEADKAGGCWKPQYNMYVGFKLLMGLIRSKGVFGGAKAFNGAGAAADAYANDWMDKQRKWHIYFTKD